MKKSILAYQGQKFTIEWYINEKGKTEALDYYKDLSIDQQKKTIKLFKLMAETGKIFNEEKFRYEGDQIFTFKPSPDRFLCFFFEDSKIIITNAYEKKSDKMPIREKEKALKLKKDYIQRHSKGEYYG